MGRKVGAAFCSPVVSFSTQWAAVMKMRGAMSEPAQKKPPPSRLAKRPPTYSNLRRHEGWRDGQ